MGKPASCIVMVRLWPCSGSHSGKLVGCLHYHLTGSCSEHYSESRDFRPSAWHLDYQFTSTPQVHRAPGSASLKLSGRFCGQLVVTNAPAVMRFCHTKQACEFRGQACCPADIHRAMGSKSRTNHLMVSPHCQPTRDAWLGLLGVAHKSSSQECTERAGSRPVEGLSR